ncbi:MAG: CpaF/VirB11 family protein [Lachnospiraceae bacterium]|nr:CpaF/VirB11 family protein [Lachnospiraceae bacterium]
MSEKVIIEESSSYFGPLYPYVCDDEITDIDYNGRDLWLTTCKNERYRCRQANITEDFVEEFTRRVSNTVSKPFHKQSPILEAETDTLRITIVHESAAISGRTICIRKSMPFVRLTREGMIEDGYASDEIIDLLRSCVLARLNMVFCGEPGVGKTECAKFFSQFIPANERVITIEDNPEWHFSSISPNSDSVELRINPMMDYTLAIKTCLRLNPKWMMLSEVRSKEAVHLIEGFSTGVRGMTTLHTDDVRKVPDRIMNMAKATGDGGRFINDIYSFIDVAVLIRRKAFCDEGREVIRRYIDQIGFFAREGDENRIFMAADKGRLLAEDMPSYILDKLKDTGYTPPSLPALKEVKEIQSLPGSDEDIKQRELKMQKYMEQIGAGFLSACNERGTYIGKTEALG